MDVKTLMSELIDIQMGRVRDMRNYVLKDIDGDRFPEPEWLSSQMSNSITMAAQLIAQYVEMNDFNEDEFKKTIVEYLVLNNAQIEKLQNERNVAADRLSSQWMLKNIMKFSDEDIDSILRERQITTVSWLASYANSRGYDDEQYAVYLRENTGLSEPEIQLLVQVRKEHRDSK